MTEPATGTYHDTEQSTACSNRKRTSAGHGENVKEEEGGRYQTRRTMEATVYGHGDTEQVCEKAEVGPSEEGNNVDQRERPGAKAGLGDRGDSIAEGEEVGGHII